METGQYLFLPVVEKQEDTLLLESDKVTEGADWHFTEDLIEWDSHWGDWPTRLPPLEGFGWKHFC